jgi:hypothetical protein
MCSPRNDNSGKGWNINTHFETYIIYQSKLLFFPSQWKTGDVSKHQLRKREINLTI